VRKDLYQLYVTYAKTLKAEGEPIMIVSQSTFTQKIK